jgi:glycolate oxidase FAD binding subunit
MKMEHNIETHLVDQVLAAAAHVTPLRIHGGNSKVFYGRACVGVPLDVSDHRGIIAYEPTELVITARSGTPLADIEAALAANNQMLPFEPPHFSPFTTLGGMVAAGLSGPRRPWGGSVRDAVLGVKLINGRGEVLRLGGQVMKNVAGYDVSRLMAGALGTLGVLLEVSIKVLPRPACERTLVFETDANLVRPEMPISASLQVDGKHYLRLSASSRCVETAAQSLGGEAGDAAIWAAARDQTLPFFSGSAPLWRVSLPAAAPALDVPGHSLIEWGGALRWLRTDLPAAMLRQRVAAQGGHATLFRGHHGAGEIFQPLPPAMLALHQRVKKALDPHGIFNPGRLYAEL